MDTFEISSVHLRRNFSPVDGAKLLMHSNGMKENSSIFLIRNNEITREILNRNTVKGPTYEIIPRY